MPRHRLVATSVAVALTIGVVELASSAGASVPTATAKVVRTDLSTTQQANGTITFADTYTIIDPAGTPNQTVIQAQQAVASAQTNLNGATTALTDSNNVDTLTVAQAQATVNKDTATLEADQAQHSNAQTLAKDTATSDADQAGLALAQAKATQVIDQAQAAVNSANQGLANAQAQLTAASQNATIAGGSYSQLPAAGQRVNQAQTLYAVDGRPVPLFYGTVTPWRDITPGMSDGPDVLELETNLVQLGFAPGLTPSNHYGPAAMSAVERWQASLGVAQTGQVRLGEIIFEPEALRVTNVHVAAGGPVQPGQTVFDATGTNPAVTVPLNVSQEYLVHQGDPVTVDLPDGKTSVTGHVGHVSDVATVVQSPSQPGTPATNPSNNGPQATVNVTVTLDNFTLQGPIDEEPVTVELTDQTAKDVLAVPVTALLALAGGGYGVKVVGGPAPRIVPVQTGLFTNTLVQIGGAGITEGTVVQVPSS